MPTQCGSGQEGIDVLTCVWRHSAVHQPLTCRIEIGEVPFLSAGIVPFLLQAFSAEDLRAQI